MIEKAWGARIAGADLALRLGALDDAGDQADRLEDHLVVPDPGELGEIARSSDHHLGDRADWTVVTILGEARQQRPDHRGEGQAGREHGFLDALDIGHDHLAHDGAEHVLLGLEIEIERALGEAGAARDLHPRPGEALLGGGERRGDDVARPLLLAQRVGWSGAARCRVIRLASLALSVGSQRHALRV